MLVRDWAAAASFPRRLAPEIAAAMTMASANVATNDAGLGRRPIVVRRVSVTVTVLRVPLAVLRTEQDIRKCGLLAFPLQLRAQLTNVFQIVERQHAVDQPRCCRYAGDRRHEIAAFRDELFTRHRVL